MSNLWRYMSESMPKFQVMRFRDGGYQVIEYPFFVLGAKDPCALVAMKAYLQEAKNQKMQEDYIRGIEQLITEFEAFLKAHGKSTPDQDQPPPCDGFKENSSL